MDNPAYQPPVAKLLQYGECRFGATWPDYVEELHLKTVHIPELIRMATDSDLKQADTESLEVWAPAHAWRALGQLGAEAAVEPLLEMLDNRYDDWANEEIPTVISMIGPVSIPQIQRCLAAPNRDLYGRIGAITCLRRLHTRHPQARERCIDILIQQLAQFEKNDPTLNGFLVSGLCDLKAAERASEIERAFAAKRVDLTIMGDWDEAQVQLGLKTRQEVPIRRFTPTKVLGPLSDVLDPETLGLFTKALDPLSSLKSAKRQTQPQGFGVQTSPKKRSKSKKKHR